MKSYVLDAQQNALNSANATIVNPRVLNTLHSVEPGAYLQYSICEVKFPSKHSAKVPANAFPLLKRTSSKDSPPSARDAGLTDVQPINPFIAV